MPEEYHERRITRTLTDGDIEAIAQALSTQPVGLMG